MRVHVTGGSGFLGSHVVPLMVGAGFDVTALARSAAAAEKVTAAGAQAIAGDLDDPASIDEAFAASGEKVLVNLASLGFGHAPAIVAAAEEAGMERAVFVSTTAVTTTLDSRSKVVRLAAEATVRDSGLDWTILRPTMIYGSAGDRNMARLLRLVRRTPVVPLPGGGRRLQQPVHVDDLAGAVVAAVGAPAAVGQVYDIAGPEPLSLREVVLAACEAVGRRPRLVDMPLGPAIAAARAYERLVPTPRIKAEQLQRLAEDKVFDIGPARRDLDYDPRPFALGIGEQARAGRGMTRVAHALLLARTVRHLRPAQVAHRVRLRTQRVVGAHLPSSLVDRARGDGDSAAPGWPASYLPLDGRWHEGYPSPAANAAGRFAFLGDEREVGHGWAPPATPQLWLYHLHYFEWAWSFAAHPDTEWARDAFADRWRSWTGATRFGRGDAWSAYVVSLRAWALCGVHPRLVAGTAVDADVVAHLHLAAAFLRRSVELDVGGNHLVKNLKALVGLGVFLGDDTLVGRSSRRLGQQLDVQVLADGGHFERSPSYHCQVLGDLVDVGDLLAAAGHPPVAGLAEAVERMRRWLGAMLLPDGDVPLFNDCTLVGPERLALLQPAPRPPERLVVLQPSGYVVMRPGPRLHLVADIGPPCPPELPAHAHADCLSFELAVDGERTVVDTGTSTYAPGERRQYERSTRAHNTVEVDGADQSEVWGTFRVARRARPTLHLAVDDGEGGIEVTASHDGYRRLPGRPIHTRSWRVAADRVEIVDGVTGSWNGLHRVCPRVHLADAGGPLDVSCDGQGVEKTERPVEVASRFGPLGPGRVVEWLVDGPLPVELRTRLELRPPSSDAPATASNMTAAMESRR